MEIIGKIKKVYDVRFGQGKNGQQWIARDIVLEEVEKQYPQSLMITLFNDRCDSFNLMEGSKAIEEGLWRCVFETRARSYEKDGVERYANDIRVVSFDLVKK